MSSFNAVAAWVDEVARTTRPKRIVWCDGSEQEAETLLTQMLGEDVFYWGQMMAGALITAVPPVLMYIFAQRLVIKGLVVGGVKG